MKKNFQQIFVQQLDIEHPIICGPMYPCSNPELVAAVSEAGGIGVVQPLSLTYVFGYEYRQGLQYIKSLTKKPIGMNVLIEKSSKKYQLRMETWIDIALDEGIRFFITSLGKPDWVVNKVHAAGGVVYHDVTESKWANKAIECNIDGFIAVNNRAGGHTGTQNSQDLYHKISEYGLPVICAGGVGNATDFNTALNTGYAGVQMGTRFIATTECNAQEKHKTAIVNADENDIVLSEKVTGVPVSLINTDYIKKSGIKLGSLSHFLLKLQLTKHLFRGLLALKSMQRLKHSSTNYDKTQEFWQAGKSVSSINKIESAGKIIEEFTRELSQI